MQQLWRISSGLKRSSRGRSCLEETKLGSPILRLAGSQTWLVCSKRSPVSNWSTKKNCLCCQLGRAFLRIFQSSKKIGRRETNSSPNSEPSATPFFKRRHKIIPSHGSILVTLWFLNLCNVMRAFMIWT